MENVIVNNYLFILLPQYMLHCDRNRKIEIEIEIKIEIIQRIFFTKIKAETTFTYKPLLIFCI